MVLTQKGSVLHRCTKFQADSSFRSNVGTKISKLGRDPDHVLRGGFIFLTQEVPYSISVADCSIRSKVIKGPKISKLDHV